MTDTTTIAAVEYQGTVVHPSCGIEYAIEHGLIGAGYRDNSVRWILDTYPDLPVTAHESLPEGVDSCGLCFTPFVSTGEAAEAVLDFDTDTDEFTITPDGSVSAAASESSGYATGLTVGAMIALGVTDVEPSEFQRIVLELADEITNA